MIKIILYIDPGTGSMLFAALLGVFSTLVFFLKKVFIKLKYRGASREKAIESAMDKHNVVLFSEGKQYVKCFRGVVDELEKRGVDSTYLTMDENDELLKSKFENVKCSYIGNDFKAFSYLNRISANIVLSTTPGLDVYQWKKSDKVDMYAHFFHDIGSGTMYRMLGIDFYDSILMSGEFQEEYIREIEDIRGIPHKELVSVGCTYMDVLQEQIKTRTVKTIFENQNKTIIWAPTWGKSSTLKYYETIINTLTESSFNVIVRPHPESFKVENELIEKVKQLCSNHENVYFDNNVDNFNSLSAADLLISDFSGVMIDALFCFDKPVIMADIEYDLSIYDASWSEKECWIIKTVEDLGKKIKISDFQQIDKIATDLINDSEKAKLRREYSDKYWCNKGQSAQKIVDWVEENLK